MTSRSTLGGYEQSTGSHYGHGTQPGLYYPKTFASKAFELASHRASPLAVRPYGVARVRQQDDRALFPAVSPAFKSLQLPQPLLDVLAIAVAVVFGLSGAAALIVGLFMALFVKF